ncbi:hypothetical protein [Streptomyces sp. NPDC048644]|uniref:aromatic-ring hydroxylase C-terminal domain-containing protein n=1 Tax=Streptomyces sp. NPDC048644 TaxID=3365582 RepID=UPI00371B219C
MRTRSARLTRRRESRSPARDRVDGSHHCGGDSFFRPDGDVAWAGADPDGLKAALVRWFGPR